MKALTAKQKRCIQIIKDFEKKLALGYESTLDFNHGLILGFDSLGFIDRKFTNELLANFAHPDCGEPEQCDKLEQKYKRILS